MADFTYTLKNAPIVINIDNISYTNIYYIIIKKFFGINEKFYRIYLYSNTHSEVGYFDIFTDNSDGLYFEEGQNHLLFTTKKTSILLLKYDGEYGIVESNLN